MGEHDYLIQWGLAFLGIAQAIFIWILSALYGRVREVANELRDEIKGIKDETKAIWASVRQHHEDVHAHGNGMPRGETMARLSALEVDVRRVEREARDWMIENRADHQAIAVRLDKIYDLLVDTQGEGTEP